MSYGSMILTILAILLFGPAILFWVNDRVGRRVADEEKERGKRPPEEIP